MSRCRFLDAGSFTTTQGSIGTRPGWEEPSRNESDRLMAAADELARQQANGADMAMLAKLNPELAAQLIRYAAEQIGYRGAGANDPADHLLDVDERYEDGEDEDMEDGEGQTAGFEIPAVRASETDLMDALEGWALEEGFDSARQFAERKPARFAEVMQAAARNVGDGR